MADAQTLAAIKESARQHAGELGLPKRHLERWHYTDLQKFLPQGLPMPTVANADKAEIDVPSAFFAPANPLRLVFMDGVLQTQQSSFETIKSELMAAGITLSRLDEASDLTALQGFEADGFLAANTAYFIDGIHLSVAGEVARPLEIVWAGTKSEQAAYGRVVLNLAPNARLTLLETHIGSGLNHVVMDTQISAGATLNLVKTHCADEDQLGVVQNRVTLAQAAHYKSICLALSGSLVRHETNLKLCEANAEAHIASAVIGAHTQHVDMTTCLEHLHADTQSETVARTVLCDQARGVFQGKVIVAKDAQRVNALQKSDALMLSEKAEMNAKPELEIYADDVACAHGSAIGEIDRDALFFLRSRGLTLDQARLLLIDGFLSEIIERLDDEMIVMSLKNLIAQKLRAVGFDSAAGSLS
ncbi:MAG: Fe-S cluster assembly protein SufD [Parvibaculales bacterium]